MSGKLQTIIGDPPEPSPVPVADDTAPFDPLRFDLAAAIKERAERTDAVAVARKTVERLTDFVGQVEKRQPGMGVSGEDPFHEESVRIAESARFRVPEVVSPS